MARNQDLNKCKDLCGMVSSVCGGIDYFDRYCYIIPPEMYNKNKLIDEDNSLHFTVEPC